MPTRQAMCRAIAKALDLPDDFPLPPETEIARIPGWDSLGWVGVIAAIEELSSREFSLDHIDSIKTVDELFALLQPSSFQPTDD